jgi:pyruvate/2-oxoacid:ferredoxin oxidoreductase beta subunit
MQGEPFKVSEVIAQLDGSVYVERTALFDQKTRKRTKNAILKILRLQMEGRGFGFVEVLSECPTHLKLSPVEAEAWVRDQMVPVFPLGVFDDEERDAWFHPAKREFEPERSAEVLQATNEVPPRFGGGPGGPSRSHAAPDGCVLPDGDPDQ